MDPELDNDLLAPQLTELFDVDALQSMMDDFYSLTHVPMSVIDLRGTVIVGSGWQEVCTEFHRANPEACANCIESDTIFTAGVPAGESRLYKCKNGMWDAAMPVIVEGRHIANVFTGQFFIDDDPIDTEFFRQQAHRYGFDERDYLAAVSKAPQLSRSTVEVALAFLTKLAGMISQLGWLALENARLFKEEHEIVERLQDTLIILPSHVPGIRFSRAYESATFEIGRVGGDFVDVFEICDDRVGIVLGDVSGKGIEAAVTTSLIRTTIRVHALDGLPPSHVASKTNRMMRRFTDTQSFVTLWLGILDTRTGQLRYVCAGHPPALIVSSDGDISRLDSRDPILGAFDQATFFESQTVLVSGDRLILYSDGVTEARSPRGDFLGEDGLIDAVGRYRDQETSTLSQAIMGDVRDVSEGVLRDDAAILVVEPVSLV